MLSQVCSDAFESPIPERGGAGLVDLPADESETGILMMQMLHEAS